MPIYMKYDGINGEVTAAGHEKWIELGGVTWGVGLSLLVWGCCVVNGV